MVTVLLSSCVATGGRVLSESCEEYRHGLPCVKRKDSLRMIGEMHEGCYWVGEIFDLLDHA